MKLKTTRARRVFHLCHKPSTGGRKKPTVSAVWHDPENRGEGKSEHFPLMQKLGYKSELDMLVGVLSNYNEIRAGKEDSLLLVKRDKMKNGNPTVSVVLNPLNESGAYEVSSIFIGYDSFLDRQDFLALKKRKSLSAMKPQTAAWRVWRGAG